MLLLNKQNIQDSFQIWLRHESRAGITGPKGATELGAAWTRRKNLDSNGDNTIVWGNKWRTQDVEMIEITTTSNVAAEDRVATTAQGMLTISTHNNQAMETVFIQIW